MAKKAKAARLKAEKEWRERQRFNLHQKQLILQSQRQKEKYCNHDQNQSDDTPNEKDQNENPVRNFIYPNIIHNNGGSSIEPTESKSVRFKSVPDKDQSSNPTVNTSNAIFGRDYSSSIGISSSISDLDPHAGVKDSKNNHQSLSSSSSSITSSSIFPFNESPTRQDEQQNVILNSIIHQPNELAKTNKSSSSAGIWDPIGQDIFSDTETEWDEHDEENENDVSLFLNDPSTSSFIDKAASEVAQESSPIWHRLHMTAEESRKYWIELWLIMIGSFLGVLILGM